MKKYLLLSILSIAFFTNTAIAQENSNTSTAKKPFSLVKNASTKTKSFVGTTNEQDKKCYPIFLEYYKAITLLLSAKNEEGLVLPVSNESIDKLKIIRNEKLRKILSADQMKVWESVLEPILIKDEAN